MFYDENFFTEKSINENVKNISLISEVYFYTEKVKFTIQIKYKSFLNIYSFCKKKKMMIKNVFVKTSL